VAVCEGDAVAVGFAVVVADAVAVGWTAPGLTWMAGRGVAGAASPVWLASMPAPKVTSPMAPDTTHAVVARDPVIAPPRP
jgi:hypothetical protein